jgi:hypothetical protein
MEQLASAASVVPQALVPVVTVKSPGFVPPMAMLLIFRVALPLLESVAKSADDVVPTVVLVNESEGVSAAIGAGAGVPVPVNVADCVVGVALSVTVRVADKLVAEAGVNVT